MSTESLTRETWRRLWSGAGAPTPWPHRTPDVRRLQALAAALQTLEAGADADGLAPSQRLAVHWALSCIADYRVALIADATGSGKTHVALAVARALGLPTAVICPRPLVATWKATATHMQVPIRVVTWGQLRRVAAHEPPWAGLAILDEAHHLRNASSGVSNAALKWLSLCRTLLLSATPVFNRLSEAQNLLGLTLSSVLAPADDRDDPSPISEPELSRPQRTTASLTFTRPISLPSRATSDWLDHFLLHRTPTQQRHFDRAAEHLGLYSLTEAGGWSGRPRTVHHVVPERDAGTSAALDMVSRVAASLSGETGAAWLHRTLLRRMASSTSALLASLRALRGYLDAGRRAALEGRQLQRREYRQWMQVEEPGAAEQQVLAFFLDEAPTAGGFTWNDRLNILDEALAHAWPQNGAQLRGLVERYVAGAAVVFTEYRATARVWFDEIRAAGIAVTRITGDAAFDSQWGRLDMEQALELFARGRRGRRILVTTSVLSEGVNLPMADVIVHADLPWTPARLQQRNGRLDRRGETSPMQIVMMQPPPELEEQARILDTLLQKEAAHRTLTSSVSASGDGPAEGGEKEQLDDFPAGSKDERKDSDASGWHTVVVGLANPNGEGSASPTDGKSVWLSGSREPADNGQALVQSLVDAGDRWRWVHVPGMSGVDIAPLLPWCASGVSAALSAGGEHALRFSRRRVLLEAERVTLVLRSEALALTVPEQVRIAFGQQRRLAEQRSVLRREGRRELLAMAHRMGARSAVVGDHDCMRWWTREFVAALGVPPRLNELEAEERWLKASLLAVNSAQPTSELREWVQARRQYGQLVQEEHIFAFTGPWLVIGSNKLSLLEYLECYLGKNGDETQGAG
jgi:hypothetical protein